MRAISAATSNEITQNELVEAAKLIIWDVCEEHTQAAHTFVKCPNLQKELTAGIEADCQELIDYIIAAKRFNLEVNARSKDRVVSFGEKLSCRFMTYLLKDRVG